MTLFSVALMCVCVIQIYIWYTQRVVIMVREHSFLQSAEF